MRVCIVQPSLDAPSETFIRAHAEHLPAAVTVIHVAPGQLPAVGQIPTLSPGIACRAFRRTRRLLMHRGWDWEITTGFLAAFRRYRPDVVLAEYGPTGAGVLQACRIADIPLVVHFHGYDASANDTVAKYGPAYREMFGSAAAVIAVSNDMRRRLLELGAVESRTFLNVYGINCRQFAGASPEHSPPTFLAVGRFVQKKAPFLTILAFSEVLRRVPDVRLRMIGDGPLLDPCKDLVHGLQIERAVKFLGAQPHSVVADEMRAARAFVQHSIQAASGDCEGTPLAVLEAGAAGLPVVSTRHAGVPDVVIDGTTGFLVDEKDVGEMSIRMQMFATDPLLAAAFGAAAASRVFGNFTLQQSIKGLFAILSNAVSDKNAHRLNHRGREERIHGVQSFTANVPLVKCSALE